MSTEEDPGEYGDDEHDPAPLNMVGFKLTELGNAERLVARYRGKIRYCYGRKKWLVWGGKRWVWDTSGLMERAAKRVVRGIYSEVQTARDSDQKKAIFAHAYASEKASAIANMLKHAQSELGIPIELSELDAKPTQLNCENGTLELTTGQLSPHSPADLITKMCGCRYDASAMHPMLERYLQGAVRDDNELRDYIQRAAGYSIQGRVSEKALFFLYGPKDSAKSTFIDAMAAMLGDYHGTADEETWMVQASTGGNRGDVVRLAGLRLVTTVEFKKGARFDEALMKKVTGGGDALTYSAKYEGEVTFVPSFALWFAANDAPAIRSDDGGMWSRMRRIPFSHSIPKPEQDKAVRETMVSDEAARSALLAWAVRGFSMWQAEGLGTATAVEESTKTYQDEMDPIRDFLDDELVFHSDATCTPKELRMAYDRWAKEEGVKHTLGRKPFQKAVEDRGARYSADDGKRIVLGVRRKSEYGEEGRP